MSQNEELHLPTNTGHGKPGKINGSKMTAPNYKPTGTISKPKTSAPGSSSSTKRAKRNMKSTSQTVFSNPEIFPPSLEATDFTQYLEIPSYIAEGNLGSRLFASLIQPYTVKSFFKYVWEKDPMLFSKMPPGVFQNVLSSETIDITLKERHFEFGENVDVTNYINGERHTYNLSGRAIAAQLWEAYNKGCSIRFLNPQTFFTSVASLCSSLQELFGTFVGANVYLTPPNSQGFAPHYDDIEAFILQLEGEKEWKLYRPRSPAEELPLSSSPDFSQEDLGEPIMNVTLKPGNVLYFPRGTIHQANTVPGKHSLHITLSTYQKNTWGHLLEKVLACALQQAMDSDVEFRKGLPINYLDYVGVAHSSTQTEAHQQFKVKVTDMMHTVISYLPFDAAADDMAKEFMEDALPPVLSARERACSAVNNKLSMSAGTVRQTLTTNAKIRLTRKNILRLVAQNEECHMFTCADNTFKYHEREQISEVIPNCSVDLMEQLLNNFPSYTRVTDLPMRDVVKKLKFVNYLWDRGLVLTETPDSV